MGTRRALYCLCLKLFVEVNLLMTPVLRRTDIRTIARWALALFVMAWLNLAIQAPVHAAMKQTIQTCCHCDTTLCDTVLAMAEKADDALGFAGLDLQGFQIAFVTLSRVDAQIGRPDPRFDRFDLHVRQLVPPPLLLKTTLLI